MGLEKGPTACGGGAASEHVQAAHRHENLSALRTKYTPEELARIEQVQQEVAAKCPDYEDIIRKLFEKHEGEIPDDAIREEIADVIDEYFTEPEPEAELIEEPEAEPEIDVEVTQDTLEDRVSAAEERVEKLRADIVAAKTRVMDLESDIQAVQEKHDTESSVVREQLGDDKPAMRHELKRLKVNYAEAMKAAKAQKKEKAKTILVEIKRLEKELPIAEYELKLLSNRGKLELILADPELMGALKEHWISAEVAKRLDYPIYMAVSERGGKDNSGDYEHLIDEAGSLVEFPEGHPQEGQPVVDQDLVNFELRPEDLNDASRLDSQQLCVAEAFVRFAQDQHFTFWENP